jgi:DNA-binding IclR family transcriptional regulator
MSAFAKPAKDGPVYRVPSVEKCFEMLELFQNASTQLSLSQILNATKIQKTTAFQIMSTLERAGYITKDASTSKYQPAVRLIELSAKFLSGRGILKVIRPHLEALQARFSETACLGSGKATA